MGSNVVTVRCEPAVHLLHEQERAKPGGRVADGRGAGRLQARGHYPPEDCCPMSIILENWSGGLH